jgi:hypothetical protein
VFTSRPISLLASIKVCVFFFMDPPGPSVATGCSLSCLYSLHNDFLCDCVYEDYDTQHKLS